jgi:hypothetical protein
MVQNGDARGTTYSTGPSDDEMDAAVPRGRVAGGHMHGGGGVKRSFRYLLVYYYYRSLNVSGPIYYLSAYVHAPDGYVLPTRTVYTIIR